MAKRELLQTEYLIIGNSAGGIGAAEAIRCIDKKGSITIVSEEQYPAYSRPLISKYLTNERILEEILFRPPDYYSQNDINLLMGTKVNRLVLNDSIAQLQNDNQISWQKLLLATGGMPIIPSIDGLDKKGVFGFLTIKDADEIAAFIKPGQHAVVIGGGLIGISVTEALKKLELDVTIIELKDNLLNTILDQEGSSIVENVLKKVGIKILVNSTVSAIIGDKAVEGVVLNTGESIPCDMVIIAIGVVPRIELALNTEIETNRGIIVDRYMATSFPNIYACGDAVESYDFVSDSNRVIPIWPNAYIGGMQAGYNMAGVRTQYPGGTAMNSLNYFGLDIATAGVVVTTDESKFEIISKHNNGVYKKLVLNGDYINGMVFIGDIEKSGMIFGLMRDRVNVNNFKQELLSDYFGLAYLPKQLWQERLGIAQVSTTAIYGYASKI
ncbi:NAD(P)/FAD-dependent oxidoreductase [Chloroflexota bacterium]